MARESEQRERDQGPFSSRSGLFINDTLCWTQYTIRMGRSTQLATQKEVQRPEEGRDGGVTECAGGEFRVSGFE
jgi:hypothetical protein